MKNKLEQPMILKILFLFMGVYFLAVSLLDDSKIAAILWFTSAAYILAFFMVLVKHQVIFKNDTFMLNTSLVLGEITIRKSDIKNIIKSEDSKKIVINIVNGEIIEFKPLWNSKKNINNILNFFNEIMNSPDL